MPSPSRQKAKPSVSLAPQEPRLGTDTAGSVLAKGMPAGAEFARVPHTHTHTTRPLQAKGWPKLRAMCVARRDGSGRIWSISSHTWPSSGQMWSSSGQRIGRSRAKHRPKLVKYEPGLAEKARASCGVSKSADLWPEPDPGQTGPELRAMSGQCWSNVVNCGPYSGPFDPKSALRPLSALSQIRPGFGQMCAISTAGLSPRFRDRSWPELG